jgi:FixJ family two-component response regulator
MTSLETAMVFVIDDDAAVRESIQGLLKSVGLRSDSFGTAQEFLTSERTDGPSCLVLDIRWMCCKNYFETSESVCRFCYAAS